MKVVFLDVDGVLNSSEFWESNKTELIDIRRLKLLKQIIDETGAVIVLSSGWKLWFNDNMVPEEGEALHLFNTLCEFGIELHDKTPDYSTDEIRTNRTFSEVKAKEIMAWLNKNSDVDKYVVLDDLDLRDEEINSHLIRTDGQVGITEDDVQYAIEMLR